MSGYGGRRGDGDFTEVIKVESSKVGRIIGARGSKIQELESTSGAKITISKEEGSDGKKDVEVRGSDDSVRQAMEMIEEFLNADYGRGGGGGGRDAGRRPRGGGFGGGRRDDRWGGRNDDGYGSRNYSDSWGGRDEGGSWGRRRDDNGWGRRENGGGRGGDRRNFGGQGGEQTETINIPSSDVGRIIGKGGSRIRELQDQSGCYIKVSRDSNGSFCPVTLSGSDSAISEAKQLIRDAGIEIDEERGW